jgi:hypothetical protein
LFVEAVGPGEQQVRAERERKRLIGEGQRGK